jgi:hypothetical protein
MSYYTDFRFRFCHNLAVEPPAEYFVGLVWQLTGQEPSRDGDRLYLEEVGRMGRDSLDCARFTKKYPDLTLRVDYRGEEFEDVGTQWWRAGELLAESRWPMDAPEEG